MKRTPSHRPRPARPPVIRRKRWKRFPYLTQTGKFKDLCKKYKLSFKRGLSVPGASLFVGVSEARGVVLMSSPLIASDRVQDLLVDLHEVLNVELSIGNNAVYQGGPMASLAGAALGGIAGAAAFGAADAGGFGAIVGSAAAGKIGRGKISNVTINLRINDINTPLVQVDFVPKPIKSSKAGPLLKAAENWTNLIEVIRYRIERERREM